MDGVVFLDDDDRQMILLRADMRVIKLSDCGVPRHKRFSFYDQIHTTGTSQLCLFFVYPVMMLNLFLFSSFFLRYGYPAGAQRLRRAHSRQRHDVRCRVTFVSVMFVF
jgi:hypothetical protein